MIDLNGNFNKFFFILIVKLNLFQNSLFTLYLRNIPPSSSGRPGTRGAGRPPGTATRLTTGMVSFKICFYFLRQ